MVTQCGNLERAVRVVFWRVYRCMNYIRSINDDSALFKIAGDQLFTKSQRKYGSRINFYAAQLAKIDNRAVSLPAINYDIATGEYRRPRYSPISVNSH